MDGDDLTQLFKDAAGELGCGEFIKSSAFNLYEAMNALELFDPKMDGGCGFGNLNPIDYSPVELSNEEIIAIMDRLFIAETAWLSGINIVHSLFSCSFLHNKCVHLQSPVLKAFCECLLKSCHCVSSVVDRGNVFEDDEYVSSTLHMYCFEDISVEDILKNAKDVESQLVGNEPLLIRLKLRHALLHLYSSLDHFEDSNLTGYPSQWTRSIQRAIKRVREILAQFSKLEPSNITPPGFSIDAARFMLPKTAFRFFLLPSMSSVISRIEKEISQFELLLSLKNCNSLASLLRFCFSFGFFSPSILVRTHLLLMLRSQENFNGFAPIKTLIIQYYRSFGALPRDDNEKEKESEFFDIIIDQIFGIFQISCFNQCRQRRRFIKLLGNWAILVKQSTVIDIFLNAYAHQPFFCATFNLASLIVVWHLLLGFELELYAPYELPIMYTYLEIVCNVIKRNSTIHPNAIKPKKKGPALSPPTVEIIFAECLSNMSHGFLRLWLWLKMIGVVMPDSHIPLGSEEIRFQQRLAAYIKISGSTAIDYSQYQQIMDPSRYKGIDNEKIALERFNQVKTTISSLIKKITPPFEFETAMLINMQKIAVSNACFVIMSSKTLANSDPTQYTLQCDYSVQGCKWFPVLSIKKHT